MIVIYDIDKQKIPIKMWLEEVESGAMEQIINLSNLPFAFKQIAIMPDCHQGYGMPIGGVLATKKVVIPNAVGVDIGCGMCAVKTSLKVEQLDKETFKKIMRKIREVIPVGFEHHKEKQEAMPMPKDLLSYHIVIKEFLNADKQIGTLGGGNHFIEIQKDTENNIWIMIHSGSRNLGYKVAKYYNELAVNLNEKWFSQIPKKWELAFLPIETQEAKNYMTEMQYCVDFALANRKLMMKRIIDIFFETFNNKMALYEVNRNVYALDFNKTIINIAHNYATWENHFGENVIVHRKGATLAREDTLGIIPGSQGTKSYIVRGLGNKESFESCSHGAGRKMGRKEACRLLDLKEEIKILDEQGIIHGIRNINNLEEASGAYKKIEDVMTNQKDLVEILVELSPLAVIKGD
jgi:tRNA-splicing ligase RtcB